MKAILIEEKGGPENLKIKEYAKPVAQSGFVLIRNKAFGINRAELYMRKGQWGETHDIIGIELAGIVENDPSGKFQKGQKVISFVGGLARDFGGSYAEYVCIPVQNVIPIETNLPWNELGAIPEAFATAWTILHWALEAKNDQSILVRGGTSTVGLAIIILAKQMNLTVIATSRSVEKFSLLKEYGADHTILEEGIIATEVRKVSSKGVTYTVDLVGTTTLPDSLACAQINGTVCVAGFLGGLTPMENFMPLIQIPSTVKLTSFGSAFVIGKDGFPFSGIPMQRIISDIEQGRISNILKISFPFDQIADAHALMESNSVNGKIVVTI